MGKGKLGTADKLTTSLPLKLSHLVKHSGSQQSDQKKSTTTKSVERVLIRRKKEVKSDRWEVREGSYSNQDAHYTCRKLSKHTQRKEKWGPGNRGSKEKGSNSRFQG